MSWRDELRDASFRGVPFSVATTDGQHGRRTVLHEFPLKDKPFVEDMGRRVRTISIEAIVLGADYMAKRDALIAAAEQPGTGKLVHPYQGEMQVSLTEPLRISESTEYGGMARISMTFTETGEITYPSANLDTPKQVNLRADALTAGAAQSFADRFSLDGLPQFVNISALSTLTSAIATIGDAGRFALGNTSGRSLFDALLGSLGSQASSLLNAPSTLAYRIVEALSTLRQLAPSAGVGQRALLGLTTFGTELHAVPLITATRAREADNQAAFVELVQTVALLEAARASAATVYESFDQATAARDALVAPIDALLEITPSDEVFALATDLRAAVVRDIARRGVDLARLVTYTPPATVPALVIAYGLYEDVSREADILARNAIMRPGFVPADLPIEVLSDG